MQDPIINQYLNISFQPCVEKQKSILDDLNFFNQNSLTQWVQIMVELGIFESVKPLKSCKALSYSITKYYYENLKRGLSWRMSRSYDSQDPFSRND